MGTFDTTRDYGKLKSRLGRKLAEQVADDDTTIPDDLTISGDLAVTGTATLSSTTAVTGRLTTTDGVAGGTARVVGGCCTPAVTADAVTAAASNNAFVSFTSTYSIPANTLKSGTVVSIKAMVRVTDVSGTDTLTCQIRLGSTSLIATTAVDPTSADNDLHILEFTIVSNETPGANSELVGFGRWITNTAGTIAHGTGKLVPTNFATNGALVLDVQAKWSSNTASTSCSLEALVIRVE